MNLSRYTPRGPGSAWLVLVALLGAAWLLYWPGLAGGFLFDDYSNLSLLGAYGVVDDWQSFWLYILSGFSGPTGRPVAHLSFLVDANHWPADPEPFKRTNVLIHLFNGLLLFGLLRALVLALGHSARKAAWVGLLAAALWLLHPFWVSTTLYVVQRMAQLATLFTLAGLWLWVSLRMRTPPRLSAEGVVLGGLAVGGFGLLAVLSKENGALLPAFALVLEATVLAAHDRRLNRSPTRGFLWFRRVLLGLPVLLLALYLARGLMPLILGEAGRRDFTPLERLLTQGRILWEYVYHIVLPRPYPGGLFNDDIRISTTLFTPWTTALAWAGWIAVVAWAWRARRHSPALAAAVLFFLVGHSLESTFLQLELYFEHRNYLPAALLGLPLAIGWLGLATVPRDIRIALPVAVLCALAVMTFLRADLWSSPYLQTLKWAQVNPESPRAQHHLAGLWWETGNINEAIRLNDKAIKLDPDGLPWLITRVMYECARNGDDSQPREALAKVEAALQKSRKIGSVAAYQTEKLLDHLMADRCGELSRTSSLLALLDRLEVAQKHLSSERFRRLLLERRAIILLQNDEFEKAYLSLAALVRISGNPGVQLRATAMLASAGHFDPALKLLDQQLPERPGKKRLSIYRLHEWYTERTGYYEQEREQLRQAILADQREAGNGKP